MTIITAIPEKTLPNDTDEIAYATEAEALDWLEALRDFAPNHPGLARAFALIRLRQTGGETEQTPAASGDPVENGPQ